MVQNRPGAIVLGGPSLATLVEFVFETMRTAPRSWSAGVIVCECAENDDAAYHRCEDIARHADRRQILLDLAAAELVRSRLSERQFLDDLGPIRLSGDQPARVFRLREAGASESSAQAGRRWYPTIVVGRERELEALQTIADGGRLATVTGLPGVGKTHLVRRFLALTEADGGATHFVDVKSIAAADLIWSTTLIALEETPMSGETHADACLRSLRASPGALVFDGCDRMMVPIRRIVEQILAECPNVFVLVTAPRRLNLPDEQALKLSGLQLASDSVSVEDKSRSEAVRLFIDRALIADRTLYFDAAAIECAHEICRRLDGNPLAIELAAAKVATFSMRQLYERLSDRLSLLSSKGLDGKPRTRLRDFIAWGFESLSDPARAVATAAALFQGAFSIDELVVVIGRPADATDTIDGVEELIDSGWFERSSLETDLRYFYMPESLRLYALELARHDAETRARYIDVVVGIAESSGENAGWSDRLAAFYPDVLALIEFDLGPHGDPRRVVHVFTQVARYWSHKGWSEEAVQIATRIVARKGADSSPEFAQAVAWLAAFKVSLVHEDSEAVVWRAVRLGRQRGDQRAIARALNALGGLRRSTDPHRAVRALARGAARCRRVGDSRDELSLIGNALCTHHGPVLSSRLKALIARGRELADAEDDACTLAYFFHASAFVACEIGEYPAARADACRAARGFAVVDSAFGIAETLDIACRATMDEDTDYAAWLYALHEEFRRRTLDDLSIYEPTYALAVREELVSRLGEDRLDDIVAEVHAADAYAELARWIG